MDYDIINLSTLQCHMSSFESRLQELDYYSAYVECEVYSVRFRISVRTCAHEYGDYHHETFTFWTDGSYNTVDTARDLLEQVDEYIGTLQTGFNLERTYTHREQDKQTSQILGLEVAAAGISDPEIRAKMEGKIEALKNVHEAGLEILRSMPSDVPLLTHRK
tara:strand:- start:33 stop:518 length:486 start_codon:yes stop_codon:yes gene_type:complete